jgi:hypothetical protein
MNYSIESRQEDYELARLAQDEIGGKPKPCELEALVDEFSYPDSHSEATTNKFSGYLL